MYKFSRFLSLAPNEKTIKKQLCQKTNLIS
jgi:hypothetical protein